MAWAGASKTCSLLLKRHFEKYNCKSYNRFSWCHSGDLEGDKGLPLFMGNPIPCWQNRERPKKGARPEEKQSNCEAGMRPPRIRTKCSRPMARPRWQRRKVTQKAWPIPLAVFEDRKDTRHESPGLVFVSFSSSFSSCSSSFSSCSSCSCSCSCSLLFLLAAAPPCFPPTHLREKTFGGCDDPGAPIPRCGV